LAGIALLAFLAKMTIWRPSIPDLFWEPLAGGADEILVSVPQFSSHVRLEGVENPPLAWTDALTPLPSRMGVSWEQYSRTLVHTWDLAAASRISAFLGGKGKRVAVKGEHDLSMSDLRESPAVILGGLNNQWTSRLLPDARFSFAGEGALRFIQDRQNPAARPWKFDANTPSGQRDRDYILISRVADSASGRVTVIAGGFSAWGTEAAVALLTSPDQMQAVLHPAPRRWDARNIQIVLECTVVNRQAGIPRLLAAHFW
jgi:hypothetical protein